jgi:dienelactone hydrolase
MTDQPYQNAIKAYVRLFQIQHLQKAETKLPRGGLVILFGTRDPIVPTNLSERFVKIAKQKQQGRQGADHVLLSLREEEHGFETNAEQEEPWLQEALQTAVLVWLE